LETRWLALAVLTAAHTSMGFQFQALASAAPPLVGDLGLGCAEVGSLIGRHLGGGGSLGRRRRKRQLGLLAVNGTRLSR
jgi:hypothetical protein